MDKSEHPPEPESIVLGTGVPVPFSPSVWKTLSQEDKVHAHAEALAKQWREDNGTLADELAGLVGCTRSEALLYKILCYAAITSRVMTETANALNYLASRTYNADKEANDRPWER